MYKVIHFFTDLQDNDFAYNVGDTFPRVGVAVSDDRFKELASFNNKQKVPLIEYVEELKATIEFTESVADETLAETKAYTKTEIQRMNVAELRKVATELGLEDADSMTGTKLKEYLISAYEL